MVDQPSRKRRGKNQNDPARLVKQTSITEEEEIAEKKIFGLDHDRITEGEKYDGSLRSTGSAGRSKKISGL